MPYVFLNRTETARAAKAEEISDVMELAEAWMVLHGPAKVLEILEPFSKTEQPESPLPWLCLLDVYRALGDRKKYEAILERIKKIFNVKLAPWDAPSAAEHSRTLADFPHIREKILELWERGEALPYLESLVRDNRDGSREGFDLSVYRDILRLITLARDPDRPVQREQLMHEKAYAMLFAPPSQKTAAASESRQKPRKPKRNKKNTDPDNTKSKSLPLAEAQHAFNQDDMSPMGIKLHLAAAYQDIDDREGACLLLEEVIQDGTPEQSEQARLMLAQLA